jgi:hypothetical protein
LFNLVKLSTHMFYYHFFNLVIHFIPEGYEDVSKPLHKGSNTNNEYALNLNREDYSLNLISTCN